MKKLELLFVLIMAFALGLTVACSDDDNDEPDPCDSHNATYEGDVKALIDNTCAFSGCHDGSGVNIAIPAAAADFTTYAGLSASLTGGSFEDRVLVQKNMPPDPTFALSDEQIEMLTCWKDAGYPEM